MKISQNLRYLYFIVLIVMSIISISALQVTTNDINIDVTYNIESTIEINITNDAVYSLFNIDIEANYSDITFISQLNSLQTLQTTLTFKTDRVGNFTESIKFEGFKEKACIGEDVVDVRINQFGLEPDEIKICQGDRVRFINDHTSIIYIATNEFVDTTKCLNNVYQEVQPGTSYTTSPYNDLGLNSFGICNLLLNNFVDVSNENIFIHSVEDDFTLTLNINSVLEDTTLTLDFISQTSFIMNYDEIKVGSLILRNNGDIEAVNIILSGDWFLFSNNNFGIPAGGTKAVDFDILPDIIRNEDTNKSYQRDISIKAQNSNTLTQSISIFINHETDIAGEGDLAYLIYLDDIFCPRRPFSFLCEQQPRIITKEVPKYSCPDIIARLTAEDVLKILDESTQNKRITDRVFNLITAYADDQNKTLAQVFYELNLSNIIAEEQQKSIDETNTTLFIIYFATTFIIIFVAGGWVFHRWYKSKKEGESYN